MLYEVQSIFLPRLDAKRKWGGAEWVTCVRTCLDAKREWGKPPRLCCIAVSPMANLFGGAQSLLPTPDSRLPTPDSLKK
ncbi:MAG: hypothetical protein F6J98_38315 [Moorea sp. SIO4G2]|nr:hypothetical protein [Moorena sp. SIO4G2]